MPQGGARWRGTDGRAVHRQAVGGRQHYVCGRQDGRMDWVEQERDFPHRGHDHGAADCGRADGSDEGGRRLAGDYARLECPSTASSHPTTPTPLCIR